MLRFNPCDSLRGFPISTKEKAIKTHRSSLDSHLKANKLRHNVLDIIKALNNFLVDTNSLPALERNLEKYRRATLGDKIIQPKGPLLFVAKETLARNIRREQIVYDLEQEQTAATKQAAEEETMGTDEERETTQPTFRFPLGERVVNACGK